MKAAIRILSSIGVGLLTGIILREFMEDQFSAGLITGTVSTFVYFIVRKSQGEL